VLAFPLSESQNPIDDEPQFLFVFLPVRPVGFNFLIQADFVTDANRQDVVQDSPRNARLIDPVADAFIKAISQFCEHHNLRYTWMRYLPDKESKNWGGLWLSLVDAITRRLSKTEVLYGRDAPSRRLISNLCRLQDSFLDEHGEPLFLGPEIVSQHYSRKDLQTLTNYGLPWTMWTQFLEWMKKDLKQNNAWSRMKSPSTSEHWHTKVAKLLNSWFGTIRNFDFYVRKLEVIPLENGAWVSGEQVSVYLPKINDLEIPSNIGLHLIAKGVVNTERIKLFTKLGVKKASTSLVRKSILRFYEVKSPDLATSKYHLKFLYLTEDDRTQDESYLSLKLCHQDGDAISPNRIYMANGDPHGPWELFRATEPGPNPGDGAPGYWVRFVHKEYFVDAPVDTEKRTWIGWLHDTLHVPKCVSLWDKDGREYIQKNRPEKFLGAIYAHRWNYSSFTPELVGELRSTAVLCRGNRRVPLKEAYFPTADLVKRTEKYLGDDVFFPWLRLEFETPSTIPPRWKTLLGDLEILVSHNDVDFALSMLDYFRKDLSSSPTAMEMKIIRLFELYDHIQERYWTSEARMDAKQNIR
jgi:hypothetical protein